MYCIFIQEIIVVANSQITEAFIFPSPIWQNITKIKKVKCPPKTANKGFQRNLREK